MKNRFIALGIMLLILMGCMVTSLHPLYTPDDIVTIDGLTGEFFSPEDQCIWNFKPAFLADSLLATEQKDSLQVRDIPGKATPKHYYKVDYQENESTPPCQLIIHFTQIGDQLFADIFPDDRPQEDNSLYLLHLIPTHSFARVTLTDTTIKFHWFDDGWLEKKIKSKSIIIPHESIDNKMLLTAETQTLRAFVSKYGKLEDAYGMEIILERR